MSFYQSKINIADTETNSMIYYNIIFKWLWAQRKRLFESILTSLKSDNKYKL